jgi:hypothetical protein
MASFGVKGVMFGNCSQELTQGFAVIFNAALSFRILRPKISPKGKGPFIKIARFLPNSGHLLHGISLPRF